MRALTTLIWLGLGACTPVVETPCTEFACMESPVGFDWGTHRDFLLVLTVVGARGVASPNLRLAFHQSYSGAVGGGPQVFSGQTDSEGEVRLLHRIRRGEHLVWLHVLDDQPDAWIPIELDLSQLQTTREVIR